MRATAPRGTISLANCSILTDPVRSQQERADHYGRSGATIGPTGKPRRNSITSVMQTD